MYDSGYIAHKETKPITYLHIPRTAGTTVRKAIGLYEENTSFALTGKTQVGNHPTAVEMVAYLGEDVWARNNVFAFIRNPWDRRLSEFYERSRYIPTRMGPDKKFLRLNDFNGWIRHWYNVWKFKFYYEPDLAHYKTTGFPLNAWTFITDEDGHLAVDFIGFYERLEFDFMVMCRYAGIGYNGLLDGFVFNRSIQKKKPYQYYYEEDTIKMVAEMDKEEIEYFGYDFEGVVDGNANSILARSWRQCDFDSRTEGL